LRAALRTIFRFGFLVLDLDFDDFFAIGMLLTLIGWPGAGS
jgi:hypothetical protein